MRLPVLLLLLFSFTEIVAQEYINCRCADGTNPESFSKMKNKDEINYLFFSGYMPEINAWSKLYKNIEYIIYEGNDYDYESVSVPESWLQVPGLKGMLLDKMSFEDSARKQILLVRPGIFVLNMDAANVLRDETTYVPLRFTKNARVPYDNVLDSLAWLPKLSLYDTLTVLYKALTAANEYSVYSNGAARQKQVLQAIHRVIDTSVLFNELPVYMLDTMALWYKLRYNPLLILLFRYYDSHTLISKIDQLSASLIKRETRILAGCLADNFSNDFKTGLCRQYCDNEIPLLKIYRDKGYFTAETKKALDTFAEMASCK